MNKNLKGIILAGGKATRLYPTTQAVCKQLLPVYDKPMIYYPLSVLLLGGIREILIITTPQDQVLFQKLLGDGRNLGVRLEYATQTAPNGLPEAFIIGERFIGNDPVCLILGDNIFYGDALQGMLQTAANNPGATIFTYTVKDPQRYGIVTYDAQGRVSSVEEKPQQTQSRAAITGLYFLDNQVVSIAKTVRPSSRGELEITDIFKAYLRQNMLHVIPLGRGYAWLDTGTYESLIDASVFIKTVEDRQGLKIGCIEEIAFLKGYISRDQLLDAARRIQTSYGDYLKQVAGEEKS